MQSTDELRVVEVQQQTQDRWNAWYRFTARFRYPHMSPLRRASHALASLRRERDLCVLEFGFGHGHLLFRLAPPARVYGIELSEQAVRAATTRARRKGYAEFGFKRVDPHRSTCVDFPENFFDLVLCSHTLEHVFDDAALLGEFHRVLKLRGRLLVLVPHDLHHQEVLRERTARRNQQFPESSYHVSNYNLETLTYVTQSAGFTILQAERFDAILGWRQTWPRSLAVAFSLMLPFLPYGLIARLDNRAARAGYPAGQALVLAAKAA